VGKSGNICVLVIGIGVWSNFLWLKAIDRNKLKGKLVQG